MAGFISALPAEGFRGAPNPFLGLRVPVDGPIAKVHRRSLKLQWPHSHSLQVVEIVVYLYYSVYRKESDIMYFLSSKLSVFLIFQWAALHTLPGMCWLNTLFKTNFVEIFPFTLIRETRRRSRFYHF